MDLDPSALGRELYRIGHQVHDHLSEPVRIGTDLGKILGDPGLERDVTRLGEQAGAGGERVLDHRLGREVGDMPVRRACLHLGEVEDVVDQPAQPLAFVHDDGDELLPLIGIYVTASTLNMYAGLYYPIIVASITFVVGMILLKETNHVKIWDELEAARAQGTPS